MDFAWTRERSMMKSDPDKAWTPQRDLHEAGLRSRKKDLVDALFDDSIRPYGDWTLQVAASRAGWKVGNVSRSQIASLDLQMAAKAKKERKAGPAILQNRANRRAENREAMTELTGIKGSWKRR
jgi:hypothetical protein